MFIYPQDVGTPFSEYLDKFNKIIMDLKNNIKIDDKDQALIVLYSLPDF
jgi:hypothetical protein